MNNEFSRKEGFFFFFIELIKIVEIFNLQRAAEIINRI